MMMMFQVGKVGRPAWLQAIARLEQKKKTIIKTRGGHCSSSIQQQQIFQVQNIDFQRSPGIIGYPLPRKKGVKTGTAPPFLVKRRLRGLLRQEQRMIDEQKKSQFLSYFSPPISDFAYDFFFDIGIDFCSFLLLANEEKQRLRILLDPPLREECLDPPPLPCSSLAEGGRMRKGGLLLLFSLFLTFLREIWVRRRRELEHPEFIFLFLQQAKKGSCFQGWIFLLSHSRYCSPG